jgi:Spy/CpxP family protein refolding chaperone
MKRLILLTTAIAVLSSVAVGAAEGPGPAEGKHGPPPPNKRGLLPQRVVDELALNADQTAKYHDLNAQFTKERDAYLASHKIENLSVREEFRTAKEKGDQAKLDELRAKRREAMKPLEDMRKKYIDQLRAVLTPDQISKLDAAKEHRQERHGKGPSGDKAGGPPPPED